MRLIRPGALSTDENTASRQCSFLGRCLITLSFILPHDPGPSPWTSGRARLPADSRVVKCNADGAAVVAVILADDVQAAELPEAGVVVRARGDEVGRVGAEGAVPHPALVAVQRRLERQRVLVAVGS